MGREQPEDKGPSDKLFAIFAFMAIDGARAAGNMPLRTGEGPRYAGTEGFLAVGVTAIWSVFYPCPELMYYAMFLLGLMFVKRLLSLWNRFFGDRQVSHYAGHPTVVLAILPFFGDTIARIWIEPAIVAGAGWQLRSYSLGMGDFFLTCGLCAFGKTLIEVAMTNANEGAEWDAREQMRQKMQRSKRKGWK